MVREKVKLSRAEALDKRESDLLKQLETIRAKRALMKVAGADRKVTDRKKFVIGGVILAGAAKDDKAANDALKWVMKQLTEARDKALFELPLTDDDRKKLALSAQRRVAKAAPADDAAPSSGAQSEGDAPTGGDGSQG